MAVTQMSDMALGLEFLSLNYTKRLEAYSIIIPVLLPVKGAKVHVLGLMRMRGTWQFVSK